VIDWNNRAERIKRNLRFWATPDPWAARRAAVRSVDKRLTRDFIQAGRQPAGWDTSDYDKLSLEEREHYLNARH
jgi:hypothetical protein